MAVGRAVRLLVILGVLGVSLSSGTVSGQRAPALATQRDHPAIQYATRPPTDRIAALAKRMASGDVKLAFNRDNGYLAAILEALGIPVASQVVVFSETSVQAELITPKNPRALFFDDGVAVGWVRGAGTLELAAHDAQQGVIFYTVDQRQSAAPQLARQTSCLTCHLSQNTQNVPGMLTFTTQSIPQDKVLVRVGVSDRSPHANPGAVGRVVRHGPGRRTSSWEHRGAAVAQAAHRRRVAPEGARLAEGCRRSSRFSL